MKKSFALVWGVLVLAGFPAGAQPTTLYWDPTSTGSTNGGGAGTWNLTSLLWFDGASNVVWTNDGTCRAVFGGPAGGAVQIASGLIIEAHSLVVNQSGYSFTGGGVRRLTVHSGVLEANADFSISMIITNPPSATNLVGIIKTGPGKLTFAMANNTFLGGLYVLDGTLVLNDKQPIGGPSQPLIINGGTVELYTSQNVSDRILYIGDNGATINVPVQTNSWLFQQNTGTNGTLTKISAGVLNLGNNSNGGQAIHVSARTGPTIIAEGTLGAYTAVGSALGTGPVLVQTNGTLAGPGLIGGAVTVQGALSPAGSGLTNLLALPNMTLANGLDMSGGGTYVWELLALKDDTDGSPRGDFDRVTITNGNLVLGGSSKLSIRFAGTANNPDSGDPFWQANHSWTIIELTGTAANPSAANFATLENATYAAGTFSTSVEPNGSIKLHFTSSVAPPPAPHIETIVNEGRTNVILTWTSVAGKNYQVQFNTNLATTNWTALTNLTATGALTTVTDADAAAPARFYRVVLLP